MTRRRLLIGLAGVAAVGAGSAAFIAIETRRHRNALAERPEGLLWPQSRPLPEIELVDQDGAAFTTEDFRGHWSLVFFGYTLCPDICPMTLAVLNQSHRRLAERHPEFGDIRPMLVSVDPQRDTPERLREYVGYFSPDFHGLTGEDETLRALTGAVGATYMLEEPDASGDYLVHHTATLFLIGPDARLAGVLTSPHAPDELAERLYSMLHYVENLS